VPDATAASVVPDGVRCPACGTPLSPEARFCPECGTPAPQPSAGEAEAQNQAAREEPTPSVSASAPVCPACGTEVVPEAIFCPECGTSIPESTPQVEAQPQAELSEEESPSAETTAEETNTCPSCGAALVPGAVFCPDCGNRVAESATEGSVPLDQEEQTAAGEAAPSENAADETVEEWKL
jgi:uncharacterized OB-fold protein